ncbi:MAG: hypothetical protein K0Q73_5914 [Paenibacillus sp.]|nr:hypothetical protein [Paenibacillus sp.]
MNSKNVTILAIIISIVSIFVIYKFFYTSGTQEVKKLPEEISKNNTYSFEFIRGMTWIKRKGEVDYPIIQNTDGDIFIYNGVGYNFRKYKIDKTNNELVIPKNIISTEQRSKPTYEFIKISEKIYNEILKEGKIRIRITYVGNGFTLHEFDTRTQTHELIQRQEGAK